MRCCFALTTTGIAVGQFANNRLIPHLGTQGATRLAALVTAASSALVAVLAGTHQLSVGMFTFLVFLFTTSFLVVMANASSMILEPHRDIAGFVSSIYGCLTQLAGSLFAILTFPIFMGELLPWAIGQVAITSVVLAALFAYRPDPIAATR